MTLFNKSAQAKFSGFLAITTTSYKTITVYCTECSYHRRLDITISTVLILSVFLE